jgi:hypothetical protein
MLPRPAGRERPHKGLAFWLVLLWSEAHVVTAPLQPYFMHMRMKKLERGYSEGVDRYPYQHRVKVEAMDELGTRGR